MLLRGGGAGLGGVSHGGAGVTERAGTSVVDKRLTSPCLGERISRNVTRQDAAATRGRIGICHLGLWLFAASDASLFDVRTLTPVGWRAEDLQGDTVGTHPEFILERGKLAYAAINERCKALGARIDAVRAAHRFRAFISLREWSVNTS